MVLNAIESNILANSSLSNGYKSQCNRQVRYTIEENRIFANKVEQGHILTNRLLSSEDRLRSDE